jgi:type IV pilus secretin PilQ/predicted competence protein
MIFSSVRKDTWEAFFKIPRRAFVLLGAGIATGIFACSTIEIEEEKAAPVPAITDVQSQAPSQQNVPQAQAIIKDTILEQQPFKLQELSVHEERGQTVVRVKFSNPVTQYRHFPLTIPSRIVVDTYGEAKRLTQVENFRVDTHWLSGLRLSSGEGYLRLVVELNASNVPAYVVEPDNGGLKVVIGPVDDKLTAKKDLELVKGGKRSDTRVAEAQPSAPGTATQAPTAQTPLAIGKKYTGQRISLDFKDADIRNVFRLLAEVSGLNIVVTSDVTRRVTLRLVDVPWDQALDLLIDTNGLGKEELGNVIRISTTEQLKKESDARAATIRAKEGEEPLQTAYLNINYAKVKDLLEKIKPVLSGRGQIVADDRSNTIVVRDIKKGIDEANTIVSRLDTRTPQVQIESNLIETSPSFARALGMRLQFDLPISGRTGAAPATIDPVTGAITGRAMQLRSLNVAGSPFSPPPFFSFLRGSLGSFRNLDAELSAAENQGQIRIISRPSVVTLNNIASTIQSLRILRITLPTSTNIASGTGAAAGSAVATERIPVGIILTVTPQVSSDGFVLMSISVKSSSIADSATVSSSATVIPFDELSREAIANVLVRDGETIVIGGIMKDTSNTSERGIPYLKDIPVLGWLFKNIRWQKDLEELMVFITPRIVSGGSENLPTAEQLWREQLKKTDGS